MENPTRSCIETHRGLAVAYANRFIRYTPQHADDYIAAAHLGLAEACVSFRRDRGRWSSWATLHIRKRVHEAVRVTEYPELTAAAFEDRHQVKRALADLDTGDGVEPADEDVAFWTGLSLRRVQQVRHRVRLVPVEDSWHGDPGDDATTSDDWADQLATNSLVAYLQRWGLWVLPSRQRHVIARRFGLGGQEPATYRELAIDLAMSAQGVLNIEKAALLRLADVLAEEPATSLRQRRASSSR